MLGEGVVGEGVQAPGCFGAGGATKTLEVSEGMRGGWSMDLVVSCPAARNVGISSQTNRIQYQHRHPLTQNRKTLTRQNVVVRQPLPFRNISIHVRLDQHSQQIVPLPASFKDGIFLSSRRFSMQQRLPPLPNKIPAYPLHRVLRFLFVSGTFGWLYRVTVRSVEGEMKSGVKQSQANIQKKKS